MDKAETHRYSADASRRESGIATAPEAKVHAGKLPYVTTADGTMLYYKDWGTGKPIVFVNSWAMICDMWQYQMAPFVKAGYRCIGYDRRGHGRSTQPSHGYDYDTLADDLAALMEQLDLRDATMLGHSMGPGEIIRYIGRHGSGRVSKIVMLAPTTPFTLQTPDNPDGLPGAMFEAFRADMLKDFPGWLARNARPFVMPDTSDQLLQWGLNMMLDTSMIAVIECNRIVAETDFRAELPRIKVPTLIIHGTADMSAPLELTGRRTQALIPGSKLIVYEGAPHGLMLTHIERLNADILSFLAS
jgi:non-heme chloroperoxidase